MKSTIQYAEWRVVRGKSFGLRASLVWVAGVLALALAISFQVLSRSGFGGLLLPVLPVLMIYGWQTHYLRLRRKELPLRNEPDPLNSIPVQMSTYLGEDLIGQDVGWLVAVDGWLFYEGQGTHFSIKRSGVKWLTPGSSNVQLRYEGPSGIHRKVCFRSLNPNSEIDDFIGKWWRSFLPTGVPVMPPLAMRCSTISLATRGTTGVLIKVGFVLSLMGLILEATLSSSTLLIHFPLAIGLLFLAASPVAGVLQLRSIRRRLTQDLNAVAKEEAPPIPSSPSSEELPRIRH